MKRLGLALLSLVWVLILQKLTIAQVVGEDSPAMHHEHHGMRMDMDGMVMNENVDQLPKDCPQISAEQAIIVRAGKKYAQPFNGTVFTYDQREWNVTPCAKVTVTLTNEDQVRHQWM